MPLSVLSQRASFAQRSILDFEHAAFELIALNLDFFLFYLFIHENQINCFDFESWLSESLEMAQIASRNLCESELARHTKSYSSQLELMESLLETGQKTPGETV